MALSLIVASPVTLCAQQLDSAQRVVWQRVEARWRTWQTGDLERMLELYHPRFHSWNRVTGRLDGHEALLARWRRALESERVLDIKLEPIAVEVFGDFATAHYVSRETIRELPGAPTPGANRVPSAEPIVVSIRWSDYLVREGGGWLFVGYAGVLCTPKEPEGSVCREPAGK
jgi:hypothetical protein